MDGDSSLPITLRCCKRQKKAVNYKEEDFVKLPNALIVRAMVKIHYEGYSNDCDEWRYEEELECLEKHSTPYQPYRVLYVSK